MKTLAIIKDVGFGLRDCGRPTLWYTAESVGWGALMTVEFNEIENFLKKADCYDIKELEEAPIVVDVEGTRVRFVDFFNKKFK